MRALLSFSFLSDAKLYRHRSRLCASSVCRSSASGNPLIRILIVEMRAWHRFSRAVITRDIYVPPPLIDLVGSSNNGAIVKGYFTTVSSTEKSLEMAGRGGNQRGDNGWSEWGGYMAVSERFALASKVHSFRANQGEEAEARRAIR